MRPTRCQLRYCRLRRSNAACAWRVQGHSQRHVSSRCSRSCMLLPRLSRRARVCRTDRKRHIPAVNFLFLLRCILRLLPASRFVGDCSFRRAFDLATPWCAGACTPACIYVASFVASVRFAIRAGAVRVARGVCCARAASQSTCARGAARRKRGGVRTTMLAPLRHTRTPCAMAWLRERRRVSAAPA